MKLNKKYCALIDSDSGYDNQLLSDKCEKIANDFAIKFMEWYSHKLYSFTDKYTIKELLEIYKKEKKL